jgi:hypothetical protein
MSVLTVENFCIPIRIPKKKRRKRLPEQAEQMTLDTIVHDVEESEEDLRQKKITEVRDIVKGKMRDINPDKYKSPSTLHPSKKDQVKYFKIFEEYTVDYKTQKQLSIDYDMSHEHINRIIKWCTLEIGEVEPTVELNVTLEQLKRRSQEIKALVKTTEDIKEKILCYQEMRKIDQLRAKLNGTLSTALIDMSDKRTVNVKVNSEFSNDRRSGSKPEGLDKVVEAEAEIDEDEKEKNDFGFERRTGSKPEEVEV